MRGEYGSWFQKLRDSRPLPPAERSQRGRYNRIFAALKKAAGAAAVQQKLVEAGLDPEVNVDSAALAKETHEASERNAAIVLTAQCPFDKVLGCSNLSELRYEFIAEKDKATGHLNAARAPLKAHENVLAFYRELPTYNPQRTRDGKRHHAFRRKSHSNNYGTQRLHDSKTEWEWREPRSVLRGLVTPDRTTLIASTHRALAVAEKIAPGDGTGHHDRPGTGTRRPRRVVRRVERGGPQWLRLPRSSGGSGSPS